MDAENWDRMGLETSFGTPEAMEEISDWEYSISVIGDEGIDGKVNGGGLRCIEEGIKLEFYTFL